MHKFPFKVTRSDGLLTNFKRGLNTESTVIIDKIKNRYVARLLVSLLALTDNNSFRTSKVVN